MPAPSTSDLRSDSKAYRRDKNHTSKWARGGRVAPGKTCPHNYSGFGNTSCPDCASRPGNRDGARNFGAHYFARAERAHIHANTTAHRQGHLAKKVLQSDLQDVTGHSDTGSSDEEVANASDAPVPGSQIMYSFDSRGPSDGTDVLSYAVMQAVKRFENKQTEQLVKNEYDLVLDGKDDEVAYAGDAEDDFELVGYGDLP